MTLYYEFLTGMLFEVQERMLIQERVLLVQITRLAQGITFESHIVHQTL